MALVSNTITANKELNNLLKNPIINTGKKDAILTAIFGNKIDALTLAFLKIITNKKREFYIDDIAAQFVRMYKEHIGTESAVVTTAMPMDEKLRAEVLSVLRKTTNANLSIFLLMKKYRLEFIS